MAEPQPGIVIKNKKAAFEYEVIESLDAGMVLVGTEIKSIRKGKASLTDSYCQFINNELYVKNLHIAEYEMGTCNNHIAKRDRKLLLQRREMTRWQRKTRETGFTIIPLELFLNEKGIAKLKIALCRGKKIYDKRESIRDREHDRDMARRLK